MGRLSPADFHTVYGFRRPNVKPRKAHARFAVWTIPSPSSGNPKLRCCPSSLYTFPARLSGLGSGLPLKVSPTLSSSASPVS